MTPAARLLERNRTGWYFQPYKKLDATSCVASITKFGNCKVNEGYIKALGLR